MATYLIYSSTSTKNVPVGLVLGDVFLSQTMSSFNPLANSVQLRILREEDKDHQHLTELSKSPRFFTIKVNGRFDIGSLMGFSGKQCYHFSMKTWLILYVTPRIIANGNEKCLHEKQHNLLVQGDVRLVMDDTSCNIYLLRGYLYDNGQFWAQNKEHSLNLNMIEVNKMTDCNWINMPVPSAKESLPILGKQMTQSSAPGSKPGQSDLVYVGMLKKAELVPQEPIALITGTIRPAPIEPYRFGKSKFDFELLYTTNVKGSALQQQIESSSMLLTIIPQDDAFTSVYSTSGHGFTIYKNSTVKICGQLLIVDNKDGSLISRLDGSHAINHMFGNLKIYVCDENIILLDNKTRCFQIDGKTN